MTTNLEQEAREAAEAYAKKCWPKRASIGDTAEHRSLMSDVHHAGGSGFEDGYVVAAEPRERENAALRARVAELEAWKSQVPVEEMKAIVEWELGLDYPYEASAAIDRWLAGLVK